MKAGRHPEIFRGTGSERKRQRISCKCDCWMEHGRESWWAPL